MTERTHADVGRMHPARRRATMPAGRVVVALIAVAILVGTGIGWRILQRADTAMTSHRVDALLPNDPNIHPPQRPDATGRTPATSNSNTVPAGAAASSGSTIAPVGESISPEEASALPAENILILGLDTRGNGEQGVGPGTSQSDVIMVAHLHAGHRRMSVMSIPRDLYVPAPTCKEWNNATGQVSDHDFDNHFSTWKITNAYSVGGPRCTVQAVQALTGLRMDRLITIQFDGFKSIVDALGGVTMTFDRPVIDGSQDTIISHGGVQTITGEQALKLVRARKVKGDPSGDLGRIGRQQQVITALLRQMTNSGVFTNPGRMDRVVQAFAANSTVQNVNIDDLLQLARRMGGGRKSLTFTTIPTVPASGSDGLDSGPGDDAIFAALRNDQPLG